MRPWQDAKIYKDKSFGLAGFIQLTSFCARPNIADQSRKQEQRCTSQFIPTARPGQDVETDLFDLSEDGATFLKSLLLRLKKALDRLPGDAHANVVDVLDDLLAHTQEILEAIRSVIQKFSLPIPVDIIRVSDVYHRILGVRKRDTDLNVCLSFPLCPVLISVPLCSVPFAVPLPRALEC